MSLSRTLVACLAVAACSPAPVDPPVEICANGKDDDSNGHTDCDDIACAGQAGCPMPDGGSPSDAGTYGTCSKCGKICSAQKDCFTVDIANDTPLPECVAQRCQRLNTNVKVHFEIDTLSYAAISSPLRAINTRVISKKAVDGSGVTCAAVMPYGGGTTAADATQLEKSGKFNIRGYDVCPVNNLGGDIVTQPFMNVGTGTGFLIWTELWFGPVDTLTKLPTANRAGYGCFEAGPAVADVVAGDNCDGVPDGGFCRTMRVKMP